MKEQSAEDARNLLTGLGLFYRHKSDWEITISDGEEPPESAARRAAFREVADHLDSLADQLAVSATHQQGGHQP